MVNSVPKIVAFLIVFSGSLVPVLGIVALSIPRNAKRVNIVVAVIAEKLDSPLKLKGIKCALLI